MNFDIILTGCIDSGGGDSDTATVEDGGESVDGGGDEEEDDTEGGLTTTNLVVGVDGHSGEGPGEDGRYAEAGDGGIAAAGERRNLSRPGVSTDLGL